MSNQPSNLRLADARDIVASGTSGKSLPVIEFIDAQQAEIERLDGLWRTEKARADFNFEENERLNTEWCRVVQMMTDNDGERDRLRAALETIANYSGNVEQALLLKYLAEAALKSSGETGVKHGV